MPTDTATPTATPNDAIAADSFTRDSSSGWGTADTGGTWLHRYNGHTSATSAASVDGAQGEFVITTANSLKYLVSSIGPTTTTDVDLSVRARSSTAPGAYILLAGRIVDAQRFYAVWFNLSTNTFVIRRNNNNIWSNVGTVSTPSPAFAANTDYWIRFQIQGLTMRAKYWRDGDPEPSGWTVQGTDNLSNPYNAGQVGVGGIMTSANKSVTMSFDNFRVEPVVSAMSMGGAIDEAGELLGSAQRGLNRVLEALRLSWIGGR